MALVESRGNASGGVSGQRPDRAAGTPPQPYPFSLASVSNTLR